MARHTPLGSARSDVAPGQGTCRARSRCRGFTYIGLLAWVALVAVGLLRVGVQWTATADRERQQELDWIGAQYVQAIASYYESTPGRVKQFPRSLDQLLDDDRFVLPRRHLRRLYADPFSGRADWDVLRTSDGAIVGIATRRGGGLPLARYMYSSQHQD